MSDKFGCVPVLALNSSQYLCFFASGHSEPSQRQSLCVTAHSCSNARRKKQRDTQTRIAVMHEERDHSYSSRVMKRENPSWHKNLPSALFSSLTGTPPILAHCFGKSRGRREEEDHCCELQSNLSSPQWLLQEEGSHKKSVISQIVQGITPGGWRRCYRR